jgi:hypothetical protein
VGITGYHWTSHAFPFQIRFNLSIYSLFFLDSMVYQSTLCTYYLDYGAKLFTNCKRNVLSQSTYRKHSTTRRLTENIRAHYYYYFHYWFSFPFLRLRVSARWRWCNIGFFSFFTFLDIFLLGQVPMWYGFRFREVVVYIASTSWNVSVLVVKFWLFVR